MSSELFTTKNDSHDSGAYLRSFGFHQSLLVTLFHRGGNTRNSAFFKKIRKF